MKKLGKTGQSAALQVVLAEPATEADRALCQGFGVDLTERPGPDAWTLARSGELLRLEAPPHLGALSLALDPIQGALARRLRTASRKQPLPRAVGLHKRNAWVVDATAGIGRDAMVLAELGARVTAVERIPVLAALLWDCVRRSSLADRIEVIVGDAAEWLRSAPERPEVVCLDPMFAAAGSAQVKQEMQVLRQLCGPPEDAAPLFAAARVAATGRVVVKRHPGDPPLGGKPSFTVPGARVRFDVYLSDAS